MTEEKHTIRCEVCERDIDIYDDTGETEIGEGCINISCPYFSPTAEEEGDPVPLDFHTDDIGC